MRDRKVLFNGKVLGLFRVRIADLVNELVRFSIIINLPISLFSSYRLIIFKYSALILLQGIQKYHAENTTGNDLADPHGQAVVSETLQDG